TAGNACDAHAHSSARPRRLKDTAMTTFRELRPALQHDIASGMPAQVARLSWGQDKIRAQQQDGLRHLLAHAKAHSPFHRARLATVDAERFELDQVGDLPVMTKH